MTKKQINTKENKMKNKIKKYNDELSVMINYVIKNFTVNDPTTTLSDLMLIRNLNLKIQEEVK